MARPRGGSGGPDGVVVVDKAVGPTSHDVVGSVRRQLGQRRAGHAGTLDPDASGVLVVGLGRATRLLRLATDLPKSYVGEVVLGATTSTLDASGEVLETFDLSAVTLDEARAAAARLTGRIRQRPPMVSAVRVGGRRLYELAREGAEVERAEREVEVTRFAVEAFVEPGVLAIAVDCSSGTYIRSLADDLGRGLGGGAHLRNLRRTAIGHFTAADAVGLGALGPADIRPLEELAAHLQAASVEDEIAAMVRNGRVLDASALVVSGEGPWAVHDGEGHLLAIYEPHGPGRVKPLLVLPPAEVEAGKD